MNNRDTQHVQFCGKERVEMYDFKETRDKIRDKFKRISKGYYILAIIAVVLLGTSIYYSQDVYKYQNEAQDLNEQITALTATYDELDTEYQNYIQDAKAQITTLNATIEGQQDVAAKYEKISEEHAKCQETIDELNAQVTDLQSQVEELNSQINTLKAQAQSAVTASDNTNNTESYSDTTNDEDDSTNSATAWLSATGSKYHSIPDCGRMNPNKARQTTVSAAQASGYDACSKCW